MSNTDTNKLFDALSKRVDELSKRLDLVSENLTDVKELDYKFWLPIIISGVAVLIAWFQTRSSNRSNTLATIQSNIDTAKSQYETVSLQIATSANPNDQILLNAEKSALERVFNNYEYGCGKFFSRKINKTEFRRMYNSSIITFVRTYPDTFNDLSDYYYMRKYYQKYHQLI